MRLEILNNRWAVCKLPETENIPLDETFLFVGKTDREISLVCDEWSVPRDVIACEKGWRCFRVDGQMDFSVTGVIAGIAGHLARHEIPLFVISTYDTDYILVKEACFPRAVHVLGSAGYVFLPEQALCEPSE